MHIHVALTPLGLKAGSSWTKAHRRHCLLPPPEGKWPHSLHLAKVFTMLVRGKLSRTFLLRCGLLNHRLALLIMLTEPMRPASWCKTGQPCLSLSLCTRLGKPPLAWLDDWEGSSDSKHWEGLDGVLPRAPGGGFEVSHSWA